MLGLRSVAAAGRVKSRLRLGTRCLSNNFINVGDDSAFEKLEAAGGKQIYYFTASWCPPCKMIGPIFEKMASESAYSELQFLKIDVDENPDAAQKYAVRSVPTFLFVNDGSPAGEVIGADEASIRNGLDKLA